MGKTVERLLFWVPRILTILFAAFISLFALDVFEGQGFWPTIAALAIHLIPTMLVVAALVIAWRWEWIGAILFVCLGLGYVAMFWGESEWLPLLVFPGPLFLIAGLFLANWMYRRGARSGA
ncbi:MAG: hypothetical protein GX601_08950 [Anaerolineales bacterium]|nr:hypothetical protein [Anaerolineales bacterium]